MKHVAILVAVATTTPSYAEPAAKKPNADAAFQDAVVWYANGTSRYLAGWGTVKLDGKHPIRFATLSHAESGARGAYILEITPRRYALVSYIDDGRTQAFHVGDGARKERAQVPWDTALETSIAHAGGHHRGGETFTFGLRDDKLVVLSYDFSDDVSDKSEKPVHEVCKTTCTELAKHAWKDSALAVIEAEAIAKLHETKH